MNQSEEKLRSRLYELAQDVSGEGDLGLTPAEYFATPLGELGIDSLSALELSVYLEREFGARIEEDELGSIRTLEDIIALAQSKGV